MQAVRNEQKAKEVATAVDAVSEAARSIGSAQEDASALSGAALQAAAALSSLNGTAGNQTGFQAGQEEHGQKQDAGNRQDRDRKHAESKSFALGGLCIWLLAGFYRLLSGGCQLWWLSTERRSWVMCLVCGQHQERLCRFLEMRCPLSVLMQLCATSLLTQS